MVNEGEMKEATQMIEPVACYVVCRNGRENLEYIISRGFQEVRLDDDNFRTVLEALFEEGKQVVISFPERSLDNHRGWELERELNIVGRAIWLSRRFGERTDEVLEAARKNGYGSLTIVAVQLLLQERAKNNIGIDIENLIDQALKISISDSRKFEMNRGGETIDNPAFSKRPVSAASPPQNGKKPEPIKR